MPRDPYRGGKPTPKRVAKPAQPDDGAETQVKCPLCEQGLVSVEVHIAFVDACQAIKRDA